MPSKWTKPASAAEPLRRGEPKKAKKLEKKVGVGERKIPNSNSNSKLQLPREGKKPASAAEPLRRGKEAK